MAYSEFHTCWSDAWPAESGTVLVDADDATLYETDYRGLLRKIIEGNDIPRLQQYISVYSRAAAIAPGEVYIYDPFWFAAAHGSTHALHLLLEQYAAAPTQTTALDQRGFTLLNAACSSVNVETVRLLLDSQPPLGTVKARDRWDNTPLLSGAALLAYLKFEDADESEDSYGWIRDRIADGEKLVNFLLDRSASAQDAVLLFRRDGDDVQLQQQPFDVDIRVTTPAQLHQPPLCVSCLPSHFPSSLSLLVGPLGSKPLFSYARSVFCSYPLIFPL